MPRRRHRLFAAALAAVAVSACNGEEVESGPASVVPPDVPVYGEVVARPEADVASAVESIASRVAGVRDPGALLVAELERSAAAAGSEITFADDVEPWMGERIGVFMRSFEGSAIADQEVGLVVESTDSEAAEGFVDDLGASGGWRQRTHEGTEYLAHDNGMAAGVVEDFVVLADEESLLATVDAAGGEALADSEEFEQRAPAVGGDVLAGLYVDLSIAIDAAVATGGASAREQAAIRALLGPGVEEPMAISLGATEDDEVVFDVTLGGGEAQPVGAGDPLGELPADAWFAAGVAGADEAVRSLISRIEALGAELDEPGLEPGAIAEELQARFGLELEEDVLAWLDDVALQVSGATRSELTFTIAMGTRDEVASAAAIEAVAGLLRRQGARVMPLERNGARGFSATMPGGETLAVAQRGERLVAGLGPPDLVVDSLDPADELGRDAVFRSAREALGGYEPAAFLRLDTFFEVAERGGLLDDPGYLRVRPYLEAFEYAAAGSATGDDDRALQRLVLGLG